MTGTFGTRHLNSLYPTFCGDQHAALAQRRTSISHALYRITSKWQAQRLSKALKGCIDRHQCGAQRGKSSEEALIMMRIAMEMAERSRQMGYQAHQMLLGWKSFSTKPSGGWLRQHWCASGSPCELCGSVESLVATRSCSVVTAHGVSRAFTPQSGLGQGCPLAALLAIPSRQPLAFTLEVVCQGIHIWSLGDARPRGYSCSPHHARWVG